MDNFSPAYLPNPLLPSQRLTRDNFNRVAYALRKMNQGIAPLQTLGLPYLPAIQTDPNGNQWGGGVQLSANKLLYVVSVQQDYLTCNTKSDGSGTTIYVAKPTLLRASTTAGICQAGNSRNVLNASGGVAFTVTYSAPSSDGQKVHVVRSSDSSGASDVLDPCYQAGDQIYAFPFATCLLTAGSVAIGMQDLNIDSRHWVEVPGSS